MRLIAGLALTAAFLPGNPDPRVGSWTLISAQSVIDPPDKLIIAPIPQGVHLVMSGEVHLDFTARSDGHETDVPSNPAFNQIELHRLGKKASEVKESKDGVPVATVHEEVSKDGRELTISTVSQNKPSDVTVWDRTGGSAVAGNAFAGEWTEDLSKTRMHANTALKIEADGVDGIRFSGAYSYSGRLDGKQYDLKNSRNDTVQLALVDPHTVDATYRRDNQVTQQDRWVTSADDRTLTLTSKSTLETGQHLSETLVYQKSR